MLAVEGAVGVPLTFNGGGSFDKISVSGTEGNDTVVLTDAPHPQPSDLTTAANIHLAGVEEASVQLLGGDDHVTFSDPDMTVQVFGGEGDDSVVVDDQARPGALDYSLTGADASRGRPAGGPLTPVARFDAIEDVALRAAAGVNVISVVPSAATRFIVDGGAPSPPDAARDRLRVDATGATGTRHNPGATSGAGRWRFADRREITYVDVEQTDDGTPLTADIADVAPDPRRIPVSELRVAFSEPVSGFEIADLQLMRDGGTVNLLTDQQTLSTTDDGTTWALANLAGLTTADGRYVLTLAAAGSGVVDAVGSPLAETASDVFTIDTVAPSVDVSNVTPDPRSDPVDSVFLVFNEPVTGVDLRYMTLTRNGGPNLLTAAQVLTQVGQNVYRLDNIARVTAAAGEYILTVLPSAPGAGPGITDLAGNPLAAAGSDAWKMSSRIAARFVFFNNTVADGYDEAANAADDRAISGSHTVLLPGRQATAQPFSGFDQGVNGIMIDIAFPGGDLTADDFVFTTGNDKQPAGWGAGPLPASITTAAGRGVNVPNRHNERAHRVTLTWGDNAVRNGWLRVEILPTARTGLAVPDVFYFGNLVGHCASVPVGGLLTVGNADLRSTRRNVRLLPPNVSPSADHNRDGRVNVLDQTIVRRDMGASLQMLAPADTAPPPVAASSQSRRAPFAPLRATRLLDGSATANA